MSLSKKISLIILFQLVVLAITGSFVQYQVILPIFEDLEQRQAKVSIQQIEERFAEDLDDLDRYLYDWSVWDDAYEFVLDKNERFIDSNLHFSTFTNSNVNLALITQLDGKLTWGIKLESIEDTEEFNVVNSADILQDYSDHFKPYRLMINRNSSNADDQFVSGYEYINQKLYMFSIRPIYNSDVDKSANGYMLMARAVDKVLHEKYQDQLKLSFSITYLDETQETDDNLSLDNDFVVSVINPDMLKISKYYFSNEKAVLKLSTDIPRDITKNGLKSIYVAVGFLFLIGFISLISVWFLLKYIAVTPIQRLKSQMTLISNTGNYDHRAENISDDEIGELSRTFNTMIDIIEDDKRILELNNQELEKQKSLLESARNELQLANSELTRLAKTDGLTKLANRISLEEKLENDWHTLGRLKQPLSFLLMDIDFFKPYNDNYGHQAGDECLKQVALVLLGCVKRSCDLVARYGGEEFAVVLPGVTEEDALHLADDILVALREAKIEHKFSQIEEFITVSIGVNTLVPSNAKNVNELVNAADMALYQAKEAGKNRVMLYRD